MIVVGVNILLYAVNRDAPLHAKAKAWWQSLPNKRKEPLARKRLFFAYVQWIAFTSPTSSRFTLYRTIAAW